MRTLTGLLVLAAALAAAAAAVPICRADGLTGWLADGKDELAEGSWDGEKSWEARSTGGAAPAAAGPTAPPEGGSGGTSTPPPETDGGGEGTTGGDPGGADDDGPPPTMDPGTEGDGPDGDGAGSTPEPGPAPLPSCGGHFVLVEERPDPALVEKATTLTLLLFRNDAFAFIANGYGRAESTWFVDWFASSSVSYGTHKDYTVEVRLEGGCPRCAPCFDLDGASYLEARVKARTSWGGLSPSSSAKAKASTVWSGDLSASDACEASVTELLTGSERELELAGISVSDKGTRSEASESATAGKGDQRTKNQASTRVAVTNKGSVAAYAADVENNCQAKCLAGQRVKIVGRTKCGAEGVYELVLVAR